MNSADPELRQFVTAELSKLSCRYALYFRRREGESILIKNHDIFPSASIIKIPLLYAWAYLERAGQVDRGEICDLDAETQVQGAGLSWLLRGRRLPFADVLLLMIALSDNLCANLVIRRMGFERVERIFREEFGLADTRLERRLMDYEARARGLNNWVSARDCIQFFRVRAMLTPAERSWINPMFAACTDGGLWLRNIPRDSVAFCHKTGSMEGILHDWGYTDMADLFLLTQDVRDESEVYRLLDVLGPKLLAP